MRGEMHVVFSMVFGRLAKLGTFLAGVHTKFLVVETGAGLVGTLAKRGGARALYAEATSFYARPC